MRVSSPAHQNARWLHSAMSALEWSPPWADASPSSSARIAAPLREASILSTSSSSPMLADSRAASASVGWAATASGSIQVR